MEAQTQTLKIICISILRQGGGSIFQQAISSRM
jgi:hypothetical protein